MNHQNMPGSVISICLITIVVIFPSSSALPLRHVGVNKHIIRHIPEKRDLILCWVVQIKTNAKCNCVFNKGSPVVDDDDADIKFHKGSQDNIINERGYQKERDTVCATKQIRDHISALSSEVNLQLLHTFGQFCDHFLLCHVDINETDTAFQRNLTFTKSTSDTLLWIHQQHLDLKSRDLELYQKYKENVENKLQLHTEVVWFSSEYVHCHHSRTFVPVSSDGKQQHQEVLSTSDKDVQDTEKHGTDVRSDVRELHQEVLLNFKKDVLDITKYIHHHSRSLLFVPSDVKTQDQEVFTSENNIAQQGSVVATDVKKPHQEGFLKSENDVQNTAKHKFIPMKEDFIYVKFRSSSQYQYSPASSENIIKSVIEPLHSFSSSHSKVNNIKGNYPMIKKYEKINSQNQQSDVFVTNISDHIFLPSAFHSLSKRSVDMTFNDPAYPNQWHLKNRESDMDINVTGVWWHNVTGRGVTVAVVDDGLEWMNPDLRVNYNHKGSWDMNDNDPDPTPSASKLSNHHGTRCAGEIAAVANNHICGVGVAYEAQISGLRVLDGLMTDSLEAEAFNKNMDVNDIYSCSWGPDDDGRTVDGPHIMAAKALKFGVDFGRRGYGSIFVLASGNGGENKDNCNFDGYANSIYTVTIGAVDDMGRMPYYAEECASMLGVTFSSGASNKRDIVTTDWTKGQASGCTDKHTGTSAAAPLAAAMIALMLQVRPCLSWRDVQYLIILTGHPVDLEFVHSQRNGANLSHSHQHGFGLLNSWRLVNAAQVWETVPWLTSYSYAESDLNLIIPKGEGNPLRVDHMISDTDIRGLGLFILENVQLTLSVTHPFRGHIGVTLTSPLGTISVLAAPRPRDNSTDGFHDWTFTSVRCWGEKPTGNWSFKVTDHDSHKLGEGTVTKWRLTLFGTPMTSEEFALRRNRVEAAMSGESLNAKALPCPPAPKFEEPLVAISDRALKILILSGAFCFLMAIYETFEYIFCYNDEKKEAAQNRRLTEQACSLTNIVLALENNSNSTNLENGTTQGQSSGIGINDEDEEDIFDISETSRLIFDNGRGQNNTELSPEDIPLSLFRIERGRPNVNEYLPVPQEPEEIKEACFNGESVR